MMSAQKGESPGPTQGKPKISKLHKLFDDTATSTYQDVIAIIEAKIELVRIELTDKVSLVSAMVILGVILIIGIAYLITTFALLTGELLGHTFLGYFIVSLIFLSSFVFLTKLKPYLLKNLLQKIFLSVNDYKK